LDSLEEAQFELHCHRGAPSEPSASWGWEPGLSHHPSQGAGQPGATPAADIGHLPGTRLRLGWDFSPQVGVRLCITAAVAGQGRGSPVQG